MFSAFVIFSITGDILAKEQYNKNVTHSELESFINFLLREKPEIVGPVIHHLEIHGYYIIKNDLVLLLVSKTQNPHISTLQFLECFYDALRNFCGFLTEDTILKNLLLVHELMCECLDNGYLQSTNTEQLRSVVYSDPVSWKSDVKKPGLFGMETEFTPTATADGPLVRSRSQNIVKRNEVFVDVIEKLTVHFGKDESIKRFLLSGAVKVKSFIAGAHSLHFVLNENLTKKCKADAYSPSVHLDDYHFTDCVNAEQFEANNSFVMNPPQGEVSAMKYHIESSVPSQLPFRLSSALVESTSNQDCDLTLCLMCGIPSVAKAVNVVVHIPVSSSTRNVMQQFSVPDCSAEFIRIERKIKWKIKSLSRNSEVIAKFKNQIPVFVLSRCLQ